MKNIFLLFSLVLCVTSGYPSDSKEKVAAGSFSVFLKNPASIERANQVVYIDIRHLPVRGNSFNLSDYDIRCRGQIIYAEIIGTEAPESNKLIVKLDFKPEETKELKFTKTKSKATVKQEKLTQSYIAEKRGYELKDKYYTGGKFVQVSSTKIPEGHFAHDAFYQIEGPGWESDKIAYRLYLDSRNRTDLFGKKKNAVLLQQIGKYDLESNSKESYTKMSDWGMDIFKVGTSLGIGSSAFYENSKPVTISETDSVKVLASADGCLASEISVFYYGWKTGRGKTEASVKYSICGGSRLTKVDFSTPEEILPMCTGLARHDGTEFIISDNSSGWGYAALWGRQALSGDNLGIAIFYPVNQLQAVTEDESSKIVIFKNQKQVTYYFAAAWEQEEGGIKTRKEFMQFLKDESAKLSNPIQITYSSIRKK